MEEGWLLYLCKYIYIYIYRHLFRVLVLYTCVVSECCFVELSILWFLQLVWLLRKKNKETFGPPDKLGLQQSRPKWAWPKKAVTIHTMLGTDDFYMGKQFVVTPHKL